MYKQQFLYKHLIVYDIVQTHSSAPGECAVVLNMLWCYVLKFINLACCNGQCAMDGRTNGLAVAWMVRRTVE